MACPEAAGGFQSGTLDPPHQVTRSTWQALRRRGGNPEHDSGPHPSGHQVDQAGLRWREGGQERDSGPPLPVTKSTW